MNIWIIGAGEMAKEYAKVIKVLGHNITVIGRGSSSAEAFYHDIGIEALAGGIESYCRTNGDIPDAAVVAVNPEHLADVSVCLINHGCKKLLVEKPGALFTEQFDNLNKIAKLNNSEVYIAYNRRFYDSVLKAREMIYDDGGLLSFYFEFTEWAFKIEPLDIPEIVKNNWFLANSSHIIDLAFYIGGNPAEMHSYVSGKLSWHTPSGFAGAGISDQGALFSYRANWNAPGRWGLEFLTRDRRLILQPVEGLKVIKTGSVTEEEIDLKTGSLSEKFKPGIFLQVEDFVSDKPSLKTLEEQRDSIINYYSKIAGGNII